MGAACTQANSRAEARAERRKASACSSTSASSRQGRRCRGDRAEHSGPITQYGQVRDVLAAGGDPSWIVSGPARPQRPESSGVRGRQPCGISEIGQQPCSGMTDHLRTISTDMDLGTQPDTLHVESALRLDRQNPSAGFIAPDQEGTFTFRPCQLLHPNETARLEQQLHKTVDLVHTLLSVWPLAVGVVALLRASPIVDRALATGSCADSPPPRGTW